MSDDNIQSVNLVIQSVEDKGEQIKFKGSDNRTYSFFKNKRDGGMTVAYKTFQNFKVGQTVAVSYKDDESAKYPGTVFHTVISVKAADGVPQQSAPAQKTAASPKYEPTEHVYAATGRNFEKEAYVKCCSIWAASVMQKVGSAEIKKVIEEGGFWELFQVIKTDGEKRFAGSEIETANRLVSEAQATDDMVDGIDF